MDFKGTFFDTVRLRDELMSRLGEYLQLPKKLTELSLMNNAMLKATAAEVSANAAILKTRIDSTRKTVDERITSTQKLSTDILTLKDTVEGNPELAKLLTGETSIATFAINALVGGTVLEYKPFLDKAYAYSKAALSAIADFDAINVTMKRLTSDVQGTYQASLGKGQVPSLAELRTGAGKIAGVPVPALVIGGVVLASMAAIYNRRKK